MLNAPALSIANNFALPRVGVALSSAVVAVALVIIVVVLLITPTTGAG